ncbi:sensor histidine kinase [Cohnella abietis]|uniref:Sensor histidine kinase YesM n=1 Tax=Cohnella abietis TaxID=2507935 RepID=A0A3T1CY31_9BACL|nr:sensor histidine kinase [Cohnella abietis]BBI30711.1 sensor histidine kinase YesM [Cohnella abietis]
MISVRRFLSSLSIKKRLFLILTLLSLVPLILVSYTAQYFMLRSTTDYLNHLTEQLIMDQAEKTNVYLQELEQNLNIIINDYRFQKFVNTPLKDDPNHSTYINYVQPRLAHVLNTKKEIATLLYLDSTGKVYHLSRAITDGIYYDYTFREDQVYEKVFQTRVPELFPPHPQSYALNNGKRVVSYVKPIVSFNPPSVNAWIVVELNESALTQITQPITSEATNLIAFVERGTKQTIMQPDMPDILIDSVKNHFDLTNPGFKQSTLIENGQSFLVTKQSLAINNWDLVGLTPLDKFRKGVGATRITTLVIGTASFILILICSYFLVHAILRPLFALKKGMVLLGSGIFSKVIYPIDNEVGFLITTYNGMLDNLQKLEKEVWHATVREKEKELLQLQAQTNPHFLFNALEAIEAIALSKDREALGELIQCVSRMLRRNIDHESCFAPLKEEIDYIRDFLNVQHYKINRTFRMNLNIEESILTVQTLKFTLQPLVENAIKHGILRSPQNGAFAIRIDARRRGNWIRMKVWNNGAHISPETMKQLTELLHSGGEEKSPYFHQHTGLFNLYRRLALTYDNRFRMKMISSQSSDTEMTLLLPLRIDN